MNPATQDEDPDTLGQWLLKHEASPVMAAILCGESARSDGTVDDPRTLPYDYNFIGIINLFPRIFSKGDRKCPCRDLTGFSPTP